MKKENKVNVRFLSVCLITYNHKNYIKQAIDSVLMQKVNFTWELIIADDYSTDGTREILLEYKQKYPDFITLILQKKNIGPAQNWKTLLAAPTSTYIAYFDGDDYWIDPFKLQKQVDFLEANPDYVICGTGAKVYIEEKAEFANDTILSNRNENDFSQNDIAAKNRLITATILFRNLPLLKNIPTWVISSPFGDWPLNVILTEFGKAKKLDIISTVYRQHSSGSFSGSSNLKSNLNHVFVYKTFMKELGLKNKELVHYYLQHVFFVYCDTKEKAVKKEMIFNYMHPFRLSVFFDRTFLSMLKRYYLN